MRDWPVSISETKDAWNAFYEKVSNISANAKASRNEPAS